MAFRMAHGSLFAVLLRSPWWYSALIAVALIAIGAAVVDGKYLILGVFTSFPFLGISGFALYKQSQLPSRERIVEIAEHAQQLSAMQVANKIAESYTSARFDKAARKAKPQRISMLHWVMCRKQPRVLPRTIILSWCRPPNWLRFLMGKSKLNSLVY